MNLRKGLATVSVVLGEGSATETAILRECSSTTLACIQGAYNTNKLSQKTADSAANPSLRF